MSRVWELLNFFRAMKMNFPQPFAAKAPLLITHPPEERMGKIFTFLGHHQVQITRTAPLERQAQHSPPCISSLQIAIIFLPVSLQTHPSPWNTFTFSMWMKEFQDKAEVELAISSFHIPVITVSQIKTRRKTRNMINWDLQMQEWRHERVLYRMSYAERLGQLEGGIFTQNQKTWTVNTCQIQSKVNTWPPSEWTPSDLLKPAEIWSVWGGHSSDMSQNSLDKSWCEKIFSLLQQSTLHWLTQLPALWGWIVASYILVLLYWSLEFSHSLDTQFLYAAWLNTSDIAENLSYSVALAPALLEITLLQGISSFKRFFFKR